MGPLEKPDAVQVAQYLNERVGGAVGFDVWTRTESELVRTDRDSCVHCGEVVQLGRQLASLHPALNVTIYDMEKHASRAEEAGITTPTMIVRGSGRSIRLVGLFSGMLFPALLDLIGFISRGESPLGEKSRAVLTEMEPVEIEAMVMPFDPYSAYMVRLLGSLAVASRSIKLQLTEISEFPMLAAQRSVSEIPLLTINGRRFTGAWDEVPMIKQILRVLAGSDDPVVRERVLVAPYMSEEQALHMTQQQMAQQQDQGGSGRPMVPPGSGPLGSGGGSGLIVPRR